MLLGLYNMTLLLDTKFDKRKDQQIKGMFTMYIHSERTDNTIIRKQTIL